MSGPVVLPLGRPAGRAIEVYQAAGGVVEYVLIDVGAIEISEPHRTAALAGLAEIARRREAQADARSWQGKTPRRPVPSIRIDPERAVGSPIPLRAFLGRAYVCSALRSASRRG